MITKAEMAAYVRQAATARGMDPNIALRVARGEGLNNLTSPDDGYQSTVRNKGVRETSYGPYQLKVGGGLGDQFIADTGLDPRDPETVLQQIDWALDYAAQHGWSQWYGAAANGVSKWAGIPDGAKPLGVNMTAVAQNDMPMPRLRPTEFNSGMLADALGASGLKAPDMSQFGQTPDMASVGQMIQSISDRPVSGETDTPLSYGALQPGSNPIDLVDLLTLAPERQRGERPAYADKSLPYPFHDYGDAVSRAAYIDWYRPAPGLDPALRTVGQSIAAAAGSSVNDPNQPKRVATTTVPNDYTDDVLTLFNQPQSSSWQPSYGYQNSDMEKDLRAVYDASGVPQDTQDSIMDSYQTYSWPDEAGRYGSVGQMVSALPNSQAPGSSSSVSFNTSPAKVAAFESDFNPSASVSKPAPTASALKSTVAPATANFTPAWTVADLQSVGSTMDAFLPGSLASMVSAPSSALEGGAGDQPILEPSPVITPKTAVKAPVSVTRPPPQVEKKQVVAPAAKLPAITVNPLGFIGSALKSIFGGTGGVTGGVGSTVAPGGGNIWGQIALNGSPGAIPATASGPTIGGRDSSGGYNVSGPSGSFHVNGDGTYTSNSTGMTFSLY